MAGTSVAPSPGIGGALEQWTVMRQQADVLLKSGYLPQHVKTAEAS